ncbi:E3 ubiquitin-protein ligase RNF213 [Stylophora pistillata]|uniref:E3 ubiquitin-protein ligase RNF213 n=1 Tax=Stylophora pistillata TaxID=50429 RepID=A0A2B4RT95_STYPI|nr:E3 ubiquitin-protein ligase RNF213 [Stylophora pistillata]
MNCSKCKYTNLQPAFRFCPGCGLSLALDQINPRKEEEIVPAVTSEHPQGDGTDTGSVEVIVLLQQMQLNASQVNDNTDLNSELMKNASDRGFIIADNEGLGNCMFYALSNQLEIILGIKIKPDELRQVLVQYLRKNPILANGTNLSCFIYGHQSWNDYLMYMGQDGAWGDHVILCAAANCYKSCIRVVSSLSTAPDVILEPECPVDKSRTLVLGHIHEVHYVSLLSTQGDCQNKQQPSSRDREVYEILSSQQTQPVIHQGQPDSKGGIPMNNQPIERENESLEGNHHSGNAPPTSREPAVVGDSGLPYQFGATARCGADLSGSWDKPDDTEPTATQNGRQSKFDNRVGFDEGSTDSGDDSQRAMKAGHTNGETVRGPAELEQGGLDPNQMGRDDGVSNREKERMQANPPDNALVTYANQQQKGEEKKNYRADSANNPGKEHICFPPSGPPSSSQLVNANSQKPSSYPLDDITTENIRGNNSSQALEKEYQIPIQTSQSLKDEAPNFSNGILDRATLVTFSAEDEDPLSGLGSTRVDDKGYEAGEVKDTQTPGTSLQSFEGGNPPFDGGNVETTLLVQNDVERDTTALKDPPNGSEEVQLPPGQWYRKDETEFQVNAPAPKNKGQGKEGKRNIQPPSASPLPKCSLKQVEPENGVTVVFHVLLVSNLKMEEEHLHIRASGEDLGDFEVNCVDMELISEKGRDRKKVMYYIGRCTLSIQRVYDGTRYKYVIMKNGEVLWEQLIEFQRPRGFIVDRYLLIPEGHLKPGAIWHQYDGVSYIYEKSLWETVKGWFRSEETAENRATALLAFLPNWKGFLVDDTGIEMTATDAIVESDQVIHCVTNVYVKSNLSYSKPVVKKPPRFDLHKVLIEYLEPKMGENYAVLTKRDVGFKTRVSALVSTLGMVTLFKHYQTELSRELVLTLLRCLSLEADPTEEKCTMYEVVLDEFSEGLRSFAAEGIEVLCNLIMRDDLATDAETWLFAVPLLHFLRGDSKPFEEPDTEGSYNKLEWYGAQKLKLKEFQKISAHLNFSDVLPRLTPSFRVDPLLKRTFLRVIPIWELEMVVESRMFFISDVCIALITSCSRVSVSADKWSNVLQCIKLMISQLEMDTAQTCTDWKTLEFTTSVCSKLVEICLSKLKLGDYLDVICQAIKLLFTSICRQRREVIEGVHQDKRLESEDNSISQLLKDLRTRIVDDLLPSMSVCYRSEPLARELLVWSELLSIADENQGFTTYRKFLIDQLSDRARRLEAKYLVEIFCEMNMDGFETAVGETFTNLAFEAMEKIINSGKRTGVDERVFYMIANSCNQRNTRNEKAGKYGELLSMLLTSSWPKERQEERDTSSLDPRTVQFLLTWKPISGYLRFFGEESGRSHILLPEGQETLWLAKSLLDALVGDISDGSVTVEVLSLVQNHEKAFLDLLKTTSGVEKNDAECSLAKRIEELEEFRAVMENVGTFIGMCEVISPVDLTFLKKKAPKDVSSQFQIKQLCKRKEDDQIEITFFKLPPDVKEVLSTLRRVQKSLTFQDLWTKYGNKAQAARRNDEARKEHLSFSDVLENVWKPSFQLWNQHVASVKNGTILLVDVDEVFECYRNRRKELEEELSYMFKVGTDQRFTNTKELQSTVAARAAQIQRYQQLHQYANAADTIWKFKEAMDFTGDFKVVEDLRNQLLTEFKQKPLESIGEHFSEAGRALQCLDVDKAQCFEAVVHSKLLVEWLRSTIKSTQELKVLVDLALISAGESDMETKRITSLHTSCLGFAPLIFDLKETEDDKVSFDQLIKACEPVWKAVETDPMLPTKLCDTSRHLEWLKTVKESHGSVAMTSLTQAKNINSSGVYVVGHLDTIKGPSPEQGKRMLSKDVIRLTVTLKGESEEQQTKTYSIDELKDLQSKLMLIAGKAEKGKDDVELFVRNLEGVMRLATAYIDLFDSGYVHRMGWNQEFHCSKDQVTGESIAKELEEESTCMETCYLNWKKKVKDARKEYTELNFFTTQQLMTLRKEIATVCHSNSLIMSNIQVLALLESVRPNLTSEQLKLAIQHAFKDTDLLENARVTVEPPSFTHFPTPDEMVTRRSVFDNNNYLGASSSTATSASQVQPASVKKPRPKETSKIQSFLNAATDHGYSEQIALAALASLGVDAEECDLLLWCLEDADEADIEALYEDAKQNPMIAREIFPEKVESAEQEVQAEDLRKNETESAMVLRMSSTSAETIIEDQEVSKDEDNEAEISQYLTLTQLGKILKELSVLGIGATARTFPAFLKRGRPNLMLVPKDDILATVLALYMHDKKQPLPSHEEVLLCTPDTTTEEIELLWRRAIGDVEGRFYCLVHADALDFSVSKQAVHILSVVTQGLAGKAGEHYGLVVICSSENEDRANVIAALDQYRVAAPPCPSPEDLRGYLKHQFKAPPSQGGYIGSSKITWTTAGSLDPENLCVRIVSSHRGGLGKTLYVRRLTEQLPNLVNNDMVMTTWRGQDSKTFLHVTVPLHGNSTDSSMLVDALLPHMVKVNVPLSRIFHLDVSPSMRRGLDALLFNLLVLGCLCDKIGRVWRRRSTDLYIIEITTAAPLPMGFTMEEEAQSSEAVHARVKCQENVLKEYKRHAENGTFPKRWKSLKGYPKMQSREAQKLVDEAYHQAECMVLDQRIQQIEKNLAAQKESYQSLLEQSQSERQQQEGSLGKEKTPKISHHIRVKTELAELQEKYHQLCNKLDMMTNSRERAKISHHTRIKTKLDELQKKYDQLCTKLDTMANSRENKDILPLTLVETAESEQTLNNGENTM